MNPNFEQLLKSWRQVTLTDQEKNVMRHNLWRQLGIDQPTTAPQHHWWSLRWQMSQHLVMLGVLVVGIICGGGLSLAAEGTLPGNLLYPLKTKVNEPIVAWLAPTPVSKIWWQAEVINRRLIESEQVLTQTKTTPVVVQNLTKELTNRIGDLERTLGTLETENAVTVIKNVRHKVEQELLTHTKSITDTVVATKNSRLAAKQVATEQAEQVDLDQAVRHHVETIVQLKQTMSTAGSDASVPTTRPTPTPNSPATPFSAPQKPTPSQHPRAVVP